MAFVNAYCEYPTILDFAEMLGNSGVSGSESAGNGQRSAEKKGEERLCPPRDRGWSAVDLVVRADIEKIYLGVREHESEY